MSENENAAGKNDQLFERNEKGKNHSERDLKERLKKGFANPEESPARVAYADERAAPRNRGWEQK